MPETRWGKLSMSADARRRASEPAKARKAREKAAKAAAKAAEEAQAEQAQAKAAIKVDRFAYLDASEKPVTASKGKGKANG